MDKERYVKSITDVFMRPVTGYSNLLSPGDPLFLDYSDGTTEKAILDNLEASCVDNSLTGFTEVSIKLKLKKEENP